MNEILQHEHVLAVLVADALGVVLLANLLQQEFRLLCEFELQGGQFFDEDCALGDVLLAGKGVFARGLEDGQLAVYEKPEGSFLAGRSLAQSSHFNNHYNIFIVYPQKYYQVDSSSLEASISRSRRITRPTYSCLSLSP